MQRLRKIAISLITAVAMFVTSTPVMAAQGAKENLTIKYVFEQGSQPAVEGTVAKPLQATENDKSEFIITNADIVAFLQDNDNTVLKTLGSGYDDKDYKANPYVLNYEVTDSAGKVEKKELVVAANSSAVVPANVTNFTIDVLTTAEYTTLMDSKATISFEQVVPTELAAFKDQFPAFTQTQEAKYMQPVTVNFPAITDPACAVFANWSDAAGVVQEPATYTFTGHAANTTETKVVYKANYTPNKYTVTYKIGDKEENFTDIVYGTATPKPAQEPTKDGFTFKGWDPEVAATVTANATYTAKFEENKKPAEKTYTVKFVDGSKVLLSKNVKEGAKTPTPKNPTKKGYTFIGWNPKLASTVTKDVTYAACWKKADGSSDKKPAADKNNGANANGGSNSSSSGQYVTGANGVTEYKSNAQAKGEATDKLSDKVKITIQYLDAATKKSIKKEVVIEVNKGMSYNVQSYAHANIQGYAYSKTEGKLSGKAESNVTVKVYYDKKAAADEDKDGETKDKTDLSEKTDNTAMIRGIVIALGCGLALILILLIMNRKRAH